MKILLQPGTAFDPEALNIDSRPSCVAKGLKDGVNVTIAYYTNLDPVVYNNSSDEITFAPYLNSLTPQQVTECIKHWASKLKIGGILRINYYDMYSSLSSKLSSDQMTNRLLGDNAEFRSLLTNYIIRKTLSSLGLSIEDISERDSIYITAKKNG